MNRRVYRALVVAVFASSILSALPATAAVAIDVSASADRTTASTSVASPSFSTASANELLLAFVATDAANGTTATVTSVAGAGLTWSLVVRNNAQSGTSEIWRAFAAAPLVNVSVAATVSQATVSSITVLSFTGVDTSGTGGSGAIGATARTSAASGAPSASLITTRAGSWVFGVGNDWDNPISRTPTAGQSLVHETMSTTGDTYWVQKQNAPTAIAGTTVSISDSAPTTDRFNLAICEVLPAASAPATDTTAPTVAITAPAPGTVGGTTTIAATATDNVAVAGVQFQIDGVNAGAEAGAAPYSIAWSTASVADGAHTLTAVARDTAGNVTTSAPVIVTVLNGWQSTGQWSAPFDLGMVAVNAVLMRTRRCCSSPARTSGRGPSACGIRRPDR
jgi:Bacterial Ig domain